MYQNIMLNFKIYGVLKMKNRLTSFVLGAIIGSFSVFAVAQDNVTSEEVEKSFFPYRSGVPSYPGLEVGMIIDKDNVESFKGALDAATYTFIKRGWTKIEVGPHEELTLHPKYIAATEKYAGQVKLGSGVGELEGYVAGRPFPQEPDVNDPRAGEKLAFNYRYNLIIGETGRIDPFIWEFKNMKSEKVERTIRLKFHFLNYKHRVIMPPMPDIAPNPSNYYRGIYIKVLGPDDLRNTQVLIKRFEDDTKQDEAYIYLGFQRRVRRMGMGQRTDAFLGTDLMLQDFEGYNGRVSDMEWNYLETRNVLVPVYNHEDNKNNGPKDADGYGMVTYGGKGACFVNVPWSLRKMYVVEAKPVDSSSPISKRVFYIDAQNSTISVAEIYDRKNELWKQWLVSNTSAEHHISKDAGVAPYTHATALDLQSEHCTTLSAKAMIGENVSPKRLFSVQNMRSGR